MYKYLEIYNSSNLKGEVNISGAKNSALPIIASTILAKNSVNISNVPNVSDVNTMLKLFNNLGAEYNFNNNKLTMNTLNIKKTTATYDIVKTMRASILVLGPLLSRFKHCEVSMPGGCAIGARPIDLHLKALSQMGADIKIKHGYIQAKGNLKGTTIIFDKITVTGTENIIMAATLAKGTTKIINAAKEPEVIQLCKELKNAGVEIKGIGTDEIEIRGTDGELIEFKNINIIPDRIEAGTYLAAGAITNSTLTINNIEIETLETITLKLEEMGFMLSYNKNTITIHKTNKINPITISTSEYPGFPTDLQAQFMAIATQANGVSTIEEKLFENRFMHVSELNRLGANIKINANIANIYGKTDLIGADVMATDLRASSALVLAGLIAKGTTKVHRIYHIFRGYENFVEKFNSIGAKMKIGYEENP